MKAQRSLRSAWASARSDQSLRCPHEESLGPQLPIGLRLQLVPASAAERNWTQFMEQTSPPCIATQSLDFFHLQLLNFKNIILFQKLLLKIKVCINFELPIINSYFDKFMQFCSIPFHSVPFDSGSQNTNLFVTTRSRIWLYYLNNDHQTSLSMVYRWSKWPSHSFSLFSNIRKKHSIVLLCLGSQLVPYVLPYRFIILGMCWLKYGIIILLAI